MNPAVTTLEELPPGRRRWFTRCVGIKLQITSGVLKPRPRDYDPRDPDPAKQGPFAPRNRAEFRALCRATRQRGDVWHPPAGRVP